MKLFSFYILIRLLTEAMTSTESGPRNQVIFAGKETTMSCNPGPGILGVDWYFVVIGGSEIKLSSKSQIYTAAKDFSVSGKIPGESFSINSTELKHAGQYICTTLMPQENRPRAADVGRFSAQVIVLESHPECNFKTSTVKERDNIEMWCIVRYSGNWVPVIEWKEINGNAITKGILTQSAHNSLTSTLNVSVDASKHNSSYLCLTYFTAPQNQTIKDNIAVNIPEYNYTWTSPLLQILYGPKKASLSPHKEFFSEGDEVVCSAEANPSPRFEWRILENNKTFDGSVLVIRSEMIRADNISVQCTAINDATGLQAKSHIVKIRLSEHGNWSTIKIVTIVFAVICAVLVFLVLIVIQKNIKEWIAKLCRKHRIEEREADADIVPLEVNQRGPLQNAVIRNQAYPPSCVEIAEGAFVAAFENSSSSSCRNIDEQRTTGKHSRLKNGDKGDVKYFEMNASGLNSIVAPPARPSLFSMSIYASIDHTLKVPPPPPPERRL